MQIPGFTGACPNVVVVSVLFSGGAEPTTNSSWLGVRLLSRCYAAASPHGRRTFVTRSLTHPRARPVARARTPAEDHLAAASNAGPLYEMDMTSNHLWRIVTTSGYYNYVGSLTTEPCAEGVEWFLSQYIEEAPIGQVRARVAIP
jgi:hypothetical protein